MQEETPEQQLTPVSHPLTYFFTAKNGGSQQQKNQESLIVCVCM